MKLFIRRTVKGLAGFLAARGVKLYTDRTFRPPGQREKDTLTWADDSANWAGGLERETASSVIETHRKSPSRRFIVEKGIGGVGGAIVGPSQ